MVSPEEVFRYDDTQVRDVGHIFLGLVLQVVAEEQTFFLDMCTTLHLDGLKRHASVITPIKKA
jgi:hypothetical protein